MHCKRDRIIGYDCPIGHTLESLNQETRLLLDLIHGFYKAALDRLPTGTIPSLAPRLLKAGMCFGFLDPVSNIIANTVAYNPHPSPIMPVSHDDDGEEPPPERILSRILTDFNDRSVFEVPLSRHKARGMTVARRSLDGLVVFLTTHFRYLANTEALRYLRLARADLLAAVRLVERDRNKRRDDELAFSITSLTTKVALECAGVSAMHPKPGVLVNALLTMASRRAQATALFSGQGPLSPATVQRLAELLRQGSATSVDLIYPSQLDLCDKKSKKRKRNEQPSTATESTEVSSSIRRPMTKRYMQCLKLLLLGKIRGLYLQALAKLPRDGLRKRHHSSLLRGGYCYGPRDPVSNIILNTVWYGSRFPTHEEFELPFKAKMICTRLLARMECCSLYGLVAMFRACFPSLADRDAVWYLFMGDADVWKAIRKAKKHGHAAVSDGYRNAYMKAACASWHPDPDALVKFATSSLNMESSKLSAMLQGTLTNGCVESLAMALPHKSPPAESEEQAQQLNEVPSTSSQVLSKSQKRFISACRKRFRGNQNFFVRKVNEALSSYSQQKGVRYKLHTICGVHHMVPEGPSKSLAMKKFKFEYSHINFLAKIEGPNSAVTAPELFFAQCSNSVKGQRKRPSWCTPVSDSCIDNGRCFSCEFNGTKIVHPYNWTYCGCYEDFNLLAQRKHGILNGFLMSSCESDADKLHSMIEEWIYFDPNMDKIAQMSPISNALRELRALGGRIC